MQIWIFESGQFENFYVRDLLYSNMEKGARELCEFSLKALISILEGSTLMI